MQIIQQPVSPLFSSMDAFAFQKKQYAAGKHFLIQPAATFMENCLVTGSTISKLQQYEFLWIRSGLCTLTADMQEYVMHHKKVYCLYPGQLRSIEADGNLEGYYIAVSADFLCLTETCTDASFLSSKYGIAEQPSIIELDAERQTELEEVIHKMQKEFACSSLLGTEILKGLFRVFLLYLSRKMVAQEHITANTRDKQLVKKFIHLLQADFNTRKMVIDYAAALCVTPSYLNQVVKKVSGFTASHHIQQCLIMEAKRQAIHYGKSMKEIAYALGFDDIAHFSKFFKKCAGLNFSSFIQVHRRKYA